MCNRGFSPYYQSQFCLLQPAFPSPEFLCLSVTRGKGSGYMGCVIVVYKQEYIGDMTLLSFLSELKLQSICVFEH